MSWPQSWQMRQDMPEDAVRVTVEVGKSFDNEFDVDFPDARPATSVAKSRVLRVLQEGARELGVMPALKTRRETQETDPNLLFELLRNW